MYLYSSDEYSYTYPNYSYFYLFILLILYYANTTLSFSDFDAS